MLGCCLHTCRLVHICTLPRSSRWEPLPGMQCAGQLSAVSCNRGCTVLSIILLHLCRAILEDDMVDTCNPGRLTLAQGPSPEEDPQCVMTRLARQICSDAGQFTERLHHWS